MYVCMYMLGDRNRILERENERERGERNLFTKVKRKVYNQRIGKSN